MIFSGKMASLAALFATPALAAFPKRGLAINEDISPSQFGGSGSQVNWQYNWDSTTNQKQPWAEYIPMLWGTQNYHTDQWFDNAWYWVENGGSGHLLAFNEPERGDQANLSPAAAADAYRQYMHPLGGRTNLGAPAVSNDGYDWLSQFMQACHDCKIDFVPIHWYNDHSLEYDLENWVNKICDLTGRQVWITEFQGFGSEAEQSEFLRKAMPFLDNNPCVFRYAYFGTADNSKVLLNGNGPGLSNLGTQYAYSPYGSGSL